MIDSFITQKIKIMAFLQAVSRLISHKAGTYEQRHDAQLVKKPDTYQKLQSTPDAGIFYVRPTTEGQSNSISDFHTTPSESMSEGTPERYSGNLEGLLYSGRYPKLSGTKARTLTTAIATVIGSHHYFAFKHQVKQDCMIHELKQNIKSENRSAVIAGLHHILSVKRQSDVSVTEPSRGTSFQQRGPLKYSNRNTNEVNESAVNYNYKLGQLKYEAKHLLNELGETVTD
ncbi:hypothetical protein JQC92_17280 [Shewanella sp. 202IG2-18]|uniref:hypothetical protein n=1 Tax=Parashewanella hymeniacidonis TaxID=2807618 RepID=UPI001960FF7A|nr:hypothetical protein [Parashewanella hymeniacidonis]MBM7073765.1 hypothetical protein [Parashewanella hymeniacidonis]